MEMEQAVQYSDWEPLDTTTESDERCEDKFRALFFHSVYEGFEANLDSISDDYIGWHIFTPLLSEGRFSIIGSWNRGDSDDINSSSCLFSDQIHFHMELIHRHNLSENAMRDARFKFNASSEYRLDGIKIDWNRFKEINKRLINSKDNQYHIK
jgi:hypothetical protein